MAGLPFDGNCRAVPRTGQDPHQRATHMLHLVHQATDQQHETTSEAQALGRILSWSRDWPKWQRDALRRLCTTNELKDVDVDELTALCKNKGAGGVDLAAEHIPDPNAATRSVTLRAIHGIEHVNALKHGERLTFDKIGLTVVYGDNGSGKSGYARILKEVCRARDVGEGRHDTAEHLRNSDRPTKGGDRLQR